MQPMPRSRQQAEKSGGPAAISASSPRFAFLTHKAPFATTTTSGSFSSRLNAITPTAVSRTNFETKNPKPTNAKTTPTISAQPHNSSNVMPSEAIKTSQHRNAAKICKTIEKDTSTPPRITSPTALDAAVALLETKSKSNPASRRSKRAVVPIPQVRDNAARLMAASEFALFFQTMENVAIHYVTLYFIDITTSKVIHKMEQSFHRYYVLTQRKLYLRGLGALMLFMAATTIYDYAILLDDIVPKSSAQEQNSSTQATATRRFKFVAVLVLKASVLMPTLAITYCRVRRKPQADDRWLTWLCASVSAAYPLLYNKLTGDYGVTWVCLFIMYLYSCSPILFFPCSLFCVSYLAIYAIVMLAYDPNGSSGSSSWKIIFNESLYALLFYLIILLPSQQREFAIRVSYMSEVMVLLQQEQLKLEEMRSKALLNSMLPESIVAQLQRGRELIADAYTHTTVLFCEVCEFDYILSKVKPQHVVELLNIIFSKFDALVDVHGVHKVETIGAVYMVVGGCPDPAPNHAHKVADLAIALMCCMPELREKIASYSWGNLIPNIQIRIGMNAGALMAGVVGIRNPRFKLFGDTVNVASRMESTCLPGQIQLTEATNDFLKPYMTLFRGTVFVKGRGEMNTYYLIGYADRMIPEPVTVDAITSGNKSGPAHIVRTAIDPTSPRRSRAPLTWNDESKGLNDTDDNENIRHQSGIVSYSTPPNAALDSTVTNKHATDPNLDRSALSSIVRSRWKQAVFARKRLLSKSTLVRMQDIVSLATIKSNNTSDVIHSTQAAVARQAANRNEVTTSTIATTAFEQPKSVFRTTSTRLFTSSAPIVRRQSLTSELSSDVSIPVIPTSVSPVMANYIFDSILNADPSANVDAISMNPNSTEIMRLPKGLTRREVFFRVHSSPTIRFLKDFAGIKFSQKAYEFEESYRLENHARWLRFARISLLVFLIVKPILALYQGIRLCQGRWFLSAHYLYKVNFCLLVPACIAFELFTFSSNFRDWEQFTFVLLLGLIFIVMNAENVLAQSYGHAYLSVMALYQCYFANISIFLRVMVGCFVLGLYLITYLVIVPRHDWLMIASANTYSIGRNALYIFIFFGAQAWVVFNSEFKQRINFYRKMTLNSQKQKLIEEKARTTKLLSNLLPETIVEQLKENPEATIAEFFDYTTVLFTDMVNFTAYSSKVSAMELVQFLNDMYTRFDTIAEKANLYKVEIIGDAYFVVGGCPIVSDQNALSVVSAATEMFAVLPHLRHNCGMPDLNIRIGIHSGPVLAGVVGIKDPRYHLFGETVAIAHHLESSGVPGRIHISESTWAHLNKDTPWHGFRVEYHTLLSMHGYSRKIRTYFIL